MHLYILYVFVERLDRHYMLLSGTIYALSPVAKRPEPGASYPRCCRYCQPKANGKLKCSEDAMELWKTDEGSSFVHHNDG